MLDNMTIPIMRQAVRLAAGVVPLEASGGMTLSSVRAVADTGVDFISVGELTHSVQALDIHMKVFFELISTTFNFSQIRYEATSYPIPGHPIQSTLFGQAETIKRQLGSKLVILGRAVWVDVTVERRYSIQDTTTSRTSAWLLQIFAAIPFSWPLKRSVAERPNTLCGRVFDLWQK